MLKLSQVPAPLLLLALCASACDDGSGAGSEGSGSPDNSGGASSIDASSTGANSTGASSTGASSTGGNSGLAGGSTSGGTGGGDPAETGGGPALPQIDFEFGSTTVYVPEQDETFNATTLGPVEGTAPLSKYGGDLSRNVGGTGFFRTQLVDGRWYFVDPDGYLYISVALTSVVEGGDVALPEELKAMGFNGLANWSDFEAINSGVDKLPHTTRYSFVPNFTGDDAYDGGTEYLEGLLDAGVLPIVFSDFDESCDAFAQQIAELKDDPWVIGIFSDNELPFYDGSGTYGDVIERWLALDSADAYYKYAADWLNARGSTPGAFSTADKEAFAAHIVSVYYTKVSAAIRRYDANHLYIGTRLHGAAKRQAYIMEAVGPHVDAVSINFYGEWEPTTEAMDMWLSASKKPFLITEFYTKGADSGLGNADGAGWEVATQEERAAFYTNFLLKFYAHPGAIGTHWFRYIDKPGQDSNKGFISEQYSWYTPLRDAATNTNKQIYQLVEFLR